MSDLVNFAYQDLIYGLNELIAFQPQNVEDLYDAYFLFESNTFKSKLEINPLFDMLSNDWRCI